MTEVPFGGHTRVRSAPYWRPPVAGRDKAAMVVYRRAVQLAAGQTQQISMSPQAEEGQRISVPPDVDVDLD